MNVRAFQALLVLGGILVEIGIGGLVNSFSTSSTALGSLRVIASSLRGVRGNWYHEVE